MKVSWDEKACCHSGNCVRTLPEVFVVEEGGLSIRPQNATEEALRQVVAACPGQAFRVADE